MMLPGKDVRGMRNLLDVIWPTGDDDVSTGHASLHHSQRFVEMLPSSLQTGKHHEWHCPMGCWDQDMD